MRFLYFAGFIVGGIAMVLFITQVAVVLNGGGGTNGASNAATLIDLFTAKAARELGLDLSVLGKSATAPARRRKNRRQFRASLDSRENTRPMMRQCCRRLLLRI